MSPALLLVIVLGAVFVVYARTVKRVDARLNPPRVTIVRRRYNFWIYAVQNILRYVVGFVIGLALVWGIVRPNLSGGRTVEVSSQAARSPVRADVINTMNDYFADFNTGPVCRYASAFSKSLRPPTSLADCKSTMDSTPKVQHITVGPNASVNVQVGFVSRRKAEAGQRHDVCTKWTSDFRMNREEGQLRIAKPPAFRGTPAKC